MNTSYPNSVASDELMSLTKDQLLSKFKDIYERTKDSLADSQIAEPLTVTSVDENDLKMRTRLQNDNEELRIKLKHTLENLESVCNNLEMERNKNRSLQQKFMQLDLEKKDVQDELRNIKLEIEGVRLQSNEHQQRYLLLERNNLQLENTLRQNIEELEKLRNTTKEDDSDGEEVVSKDTLALWKEELLRKDEQALAYRHQNQAFVIKIARLAKDVRLLNEDQMELIVQFKHYVQCVEHFRDELAVANERIVHHMSAVNANEARLAKKVCDLQEENDQLKQKIQQLIEEKSAISENAKQLQSLVDTTNHETQFLKHTSANEFSENQQQLPTNACAETQTTTAIALPDQESKYREHMADLTSKIVDLQHELQKSMQLNNEFKQNISIHERSIAEKDSDIHKLKAFIKEWQIWTEVKCCDPDQLFSRIDEILNAQPKHLEQMQGELQVLTLKLKEKVNNLHTEYEDNKKEVSSKQSQLEEIQTQCVNLTTAYQGELRTSNGKIEELETLVMELRRQNDDLAMANSELVTWKRNIAAKVKVVRQELADSNAAQQDLQHTISQLKRDLRQCQDDKASIQLSSEQIKEELLHSTADLAAQQDVIETLQSQKGDLHCQVVRWKEDYERCQECLSQLESVDIQQREQIDDLQKTIENLKQLISELKERKTSNDASFEKQIEDMQLKNGSLQSHNMVLQQHARELTDQLRFKEDELKLLRDEYNAYKLRAQSELRQNQSRDIVLEERLWDELTEFRERCTHLEKNVADLNNNLKQMTNEKEDISKEYTKLRENLTESKTEFEHLRKEYMELQQKHEHTMTQQTEAVNSLKLHADTLAQCYRQQLAELENQHHQKIVELEQQREVKESDNNNVKSSGDMVKLSSVPLSNTPATFPSSAVQAVETMDNHQSNRSAPITDLEKLLQMDSYHIGTSPKYDDPTNKIAHLSALLADTEQDLAKYVQMNRVLKEEIRRQERSIEREKHADNLEYLKNVVLKFTTLQNSDERVRLVPVLDTILKLSPDELQQLQQVAKGCDEGIRGWTTGYLPNAMWSNGKQT